MTTSKKDNLETNSSESYEFGKVRDKVIHRLLETDEHLDLSLPGRITFFTVQEITKSIFEDVSNSLNFKIDIRDSWWEDFARIKKKYLVEDK